MCSTTGDRLTEIAAAIDELAAGWREADQEGRTDILARRLADLWVLVAELDPGIASRLPGYGAQAPRGQVLARRDDRPEWPGGRMD